MKRSFFSYLQVNPKKKSYQVPLKQKFVYHIKETLRSPGQRLDQKRIGRLFSSPGIVALGALFGLIGIFISNFIGCLPIRGEER